MFEKDDNVESLFFYISSGNALCNIFSIQGSSLGPTAALLVQHLTQLKV